MVDSWLNCEFDGENEENGCTALQDEKPRCAWLSILLKGLPWKVKNP